MNKQDKPFVIFRLDLASELCHLGYKCLGSAPNNIKPWRNVYYFEDTPELREFVRGYNKNG